MKSKLTKRYKSLRNPENENQFSCLMDSYLTRLIKLNFAIRFRDLSPQDLDMVKQEVLEVLWRKRDEVKEILEREEGEAYIWVIVSNRCIAHVTKLSKRNKKFIPPDEELVHRHRHSALVEETDLEKVFGEVDERAIDLDEICKEARLTPREKEVFICHFNGNARKDGAKKLRMAEGTYKRHLQNARKKLRNYLGKNKLKK